MSFSILPTPHILPEDGLQLITKKEHIESGLPLRRPRPPKSPVKQSISLSNSSTSRVTNVTFRESSNLSSVYRCDLDETYFEQCFTDATRIGEGAFGIVFRVRSKEDGCYYAVKKSKYPFRSNHDKRIKLEEVRKYELIPKHRNCVQLYNAWVENNFLFLQMELCDSTLEAYAAKNHQIQEEFLWNILLDMLLALKNLHDVNLIHLDVKLENILMCRRSGLCKLGDFGLVSDVNQTEVDILEGDQKYLAPEVLRGCFTKAADVFSLGIVMLELSCDLMLPQNGTFWQQLRNDTYPEKFVKNVPGELFDTIKQMMASDHLRRPTVDQLLKMSRIQRVLADRAFPRYLRLFLNNYCLAFIYYLKTVTKLPIWLLDRIIFKLKESMHSPQRVREESKNIEYLLPMANSTPKPNGVTSISDWNIDVSSIRHEADEESDNDERVSCETKKRHHAEENQTPRRRFKKSRINNSSVGRQLFQ